MPVVVAGVALAIAYVGAFLVRDTDGITGPNLFVESLSGSSSSFFGSLWIVTVDNCEPGVIDPRGEWMVRTALCGEELFVYDIDLES